jgi:hypothetical protein
MKKNELFEKIKSIGIKKEEYEKVFEEKTKELKDRFIACNMQEPAEDDITNAVYTYYKLQVKKARESYDVIMLMDLGLKDFNEIARRQSQEKNDKGVPLYPASWKFSAGKEIPSDPSYLRVVQGIGRKDEQNEYKKIEITFRDEGAKNFDVNGLFRKIKIPVKVINKTGDTIQLQATNGFDITEDVLAKEKIESIIKKFYGDKIIQLSEINVWTQTHTGFNDYFVCEADVMSIQLGVYESADLTDQSLDITSDIPYINFNYNKGNINFIEGAQGLLVFGRAYLSKDGIIRAQSFGTYVPKQYIAPEVESISGEEEWEVD